MIFRTHCLGCVSQFFVRASIGTKLISKRPMGLTLEMKRTSVAWAPDKVCLNIEMTLIYRVGILRPGVFEPRVPLITFNAVCTNETNNDILEEIIL